MRVLVSLRARLVAMAILALSPALLLILYTASVQNRTDRAAARDTALKLARLAASDHQRYLDSSHQLLIALSKLKELMQLDAPGCNALFGELLKEYPLYANLFAILPDGDLFCSAIPPARPVNLVDKSWFRQALKTRTFAISDQEEVSHVTSTPVVVLAHPILDGQGQIQGVVGVSLDPAWLEQFAAGPLPAGWTEAVLDRNGNTLVSYPTGDTQLALPPPGSAGFNTVLNGPAESLFESPDRDKGQRLFALARAFSPREGEQLTVLVSAPIALVFSDENRSLARSLLWLGTVTLLAILGTAVLGDIFVLRQVRELQTTVQHLKVGDLGARVHVSLGASELQEVAIAFNQMAAIVQQRDAELHQAQAELEARVEERTAALAQANNALLAEVLERQRREKVLQQTQDQLIQVEKMNALGRLAAALAHEINNPLQAVQTHLELLTMGVPLEPGTQEQYIRIAHTEIVRLGRLVENILNFARPARVLRRPVYVVELIEQTIALTNKRLQHAHIQLVTDLQPTPLVLATPDQLLQVFINLLLNAIEASTQDNGAILVATYSTESAVIITFANSGVPIPAENMQRIFEPFFTTKAGGTGLGLSISHTLVRDHGGDLSVENTMGEYAVVFTVTLPMYAPSPATALKETML